MGTISDSTTVRNWGPFEEIKLYSKKINKVENQIYVIYVHV